MIRPAYLDNPHGLRTRSTTTDAARDACAVERHSHPLSMSTLAIAAIGVLTLVAITLGWMP